MKIVVLSRKSSLYSTRRLVEAAQERSHDVRVLDHMKCYSVIESGNPHVHYNDEELKNVDAVIPRIGSSVTFYGAAVVRQFEMMNVFTISSSDGIIRSRDKLRSLQILTRSGVHLPKTVFVSRTRDVGNLIRQVGGAPCVIKLLEGTQGVGVVLAETPKAARSVIEAFFGMKARIIIQEYIEEAGGSDIRAFVVDDEVVGAMRRTGKEGEFRSNIHRGGKAESVELTPGQRDTALRAARAMGLSVAGVDLIEAERGPAVLEVNSSPGLEGIENATGVDIAGRIVEFIEQEVASPVSASDDGNP